MIKLHSRNYDSVIASQFLTGISDYKEALDKLFPLINRLDIQRKIQSGGFYKRLESDLIAGCIMPPLTIALVESKDISKFKVAELEQYVNNNIGKGFILDGIQRLNTLKRVYDKGQLSLKNPIYLNIIICPRRDNLLYRMVTLNNGQKPMTARHQIEMLASSLYDFKHYGLAIISEKQSGIKTPPKNSFKESDMISSYIAFLSDTTNLENSKIIESKMDELIARKIIESDITKDEIEFTDVLKQISRFSKNDYLLKWLKNGNNLISFAVGIKKSLKPISKVTLPEFKEAIESFETAFKNFDISKIKLSRERRKLVQYFIENYTQLKSYHSDDLLLSFNELG